MRPLDKGEELRLEIRSKQYQNVFLNVVGEKDKKSRTAVGIPGEGLQDGKKCAGKAVLS